MQSSMPLRVTEDQGFSEEGLIMRTHRPAPRVSPNELARLTRQCDVLGIDWHQMTATEMRQAIASYDPTATVPVGPTYDECQEQERQYRQANGIPEPVHVKPARCWGAGPCLREGKRVAADGSTWCDSCHERECYPGGRFYTSRIEQEEH
jgi:hypothetical protein